MPVLRYHCPQLPRIAILKIDQPSMLKTYLLHAESTIAYLQGISKSRSAMNTFFATNAVKHGGDLESALATGELTASHYTHFLRRTGATSSSPSHFLTLDGVQALIDGLPRQEPSAKQALQRMFEGFCKQEKVFEPATQEQCARHEEDIEELFSPGAVAANIFGSSGSEAIDAPDTAIVPKLYQAQIQYHLADADNRCLQLQLRFEKEKAELKDQNNTTQVQHLKDKLQYTEKMKDAEIEKLRDRLQQNQPATKRPKLSSALRRPPLDSYFIYSLMKNVAQPTGGWMFKELMDNVMQSDGETAHTAPILVTPAGTGASTLFRAFGIVYNGQPIALSQLKQFPAIKEAYGVSADKLATSADTQAADKLTTSHFAVIILYNRGRMLPADILACRLCGGAETVFAYDQLDKASTLDPVLSAMLNTPSRWMWFASV